MRQWAKKILKESENKFLSRVNTIKNLGFGWAFSSRDQVKASFFNRLSDLLLVFARLANYQAQVEVIRTGEYFIYLIYLLFDF